MVSGIEKMSEAMSGVRRSVAKMKRERTTKMKRE
jgi:hypothetical protein